MSTSDTIAEMEWFAADSTHLLANDRWVIRKASEVWHLTTLPRTDSRQRRICEGISALRTRLAGRRACAFTPDLRSDALQNAEVNEMIRWVENKHQANLLRMEEMLVQLTKFVGASP